MFRLHLRHHLTQSSLDPVFDIPSVHLAQVQDQWGQSHFNWKVIFIQFWVRKIYISICYDKNPEKGLHPKFVEDVLDFDSRFTKDIIDSHLKEEISYQLHEFASLRSVWSYFEKLFNNSDMKVEKDLIQSISRQLAKKYDFELPTKVRNFPIKCNPRPNLNQSNPSKRSRTDSNSLIPSKRLAL